MLSSKASEEARRTVGRSILSRVSTVLLMILLLPVAALSGAALSVFVMSRAILDAALDKTEETQ